MSKRQRKDGNKKNDGRSNSPIPSPPDTPNPPSKRERRPTEAPQGPSASPCPPPPAPVPEQYESFSGYGSRRIMVPGHPFFCECSICSYLRE